MDDGQSGVAAAAGMGRAAAAPFPGPGGNPVLDLIACHGSGLHTVIRICYYAAPAVAVLLLVAVGLAIWRVWFQARAEASDRGTLSPCRIPRTIQPRRSLPDRAPTKNTFVNNGQQL